MDQSKNRDPKAPRVKDPAEEALVELFDEQLQEAESQELSHKSLTGDPAATDEDHKHPDPLRPVNRSNSEKKRLRDIL
ncbi:hypothetical protein P12x_005452 [Tundrisphaera lichenicola]|uniref:hypothetical protein n=1 Tax=Tundrisphaera lichenicola TaxID=2029860 RepID=UPI003EBE1E00